MKNIILFIIFLFAYKAWPTPGVNCESIAKSADLPIHNFLACLHDPINFAPQEWFPQCNEREKLLYLTNACEFEGRTIYHCTEGEDVYCFNGKIVELTANKPMMTILCTNEEFPRPLPEKGYLTMGPCNSESHLTADAKGLRVEGKMSCYCQNKEGNGLAWTCYDTGSKK